MTRVLVTASFIYKRLLGSDYVDFSVPGSLKVPVEEMKMNMRRWIAHNQAFVSPTHGCIA